MREVVGSIPTATTILIPNFFTSSALISGAPSLHAGSAVSAAGYGTGFDLMIVNGFAGAKLAKG